MRQPHTSTVHIGSAGGGMVLTQRLTTPPRMAAQTTQPSLAILCRALLRRWCGKRVLRARMGQMRAVLPGEHQLA
jgi:hypothetical protein